MIKGCLLILTALTIYYTISDPKPVPVQFEEPETVKADTTREPLKFDWKNNKYIYTDEVEPNPVYPPLDRELEYMPDVAVWGETGPTATEVEYIVSEGKRYRIIRKPGGTIELREWR